MRKFLSWKIISANIFQLKKYQKALFTVESIVMKLDYAQKTKKFNKEKAKMKETKIKEFKQYFNNNPKTTVRK